jgi:heme exporter protein A
LPHPWAIHFFGAGRPGLERSKALLLLADNLTLARGQRVLIRDLSLAAREGEALVIVGPNGAGKTTLIRALAGFIRPEAGRIELEGGDPERDRAEQCHYVGHLTGLKANLTAFENLVFWSDYLAMGPSSQPTAARVNAALARLALSHLADIPAGLLSAGQKRRLSLARLLVAARPVWLLDEPTSSLDDASTALLTGILNEHLARGGIIVAATHLPLSLQNTTTLRLGETGAAA